MRWHEAEPARSNRAGATPSRCERRARARTPWHRHPAPSARRAGTSRVAASARRRRHTEAERARAMAPARRAGGDAPEDRARAAARTRRRRGPPADLHRSAGLGRPRQPAHCAGASRSSAPERRVRQASVDIDFECAGGGAERRGGKRLLAGPGHDEVAQRTARLHGRPSRFEAQAGSASSRSSPRSSTRSRRGASAQRRSRSKCSRASGSKTWMTTSLESISTH